MALITIADLRDGMTRRLALVTGASRGIGQATAVRLARDGFDVVVHYHVKKAGAEATRRQVEAAGGWAMIVGADLSQPAQVQALWKKVQGERAGVQVLVNNAGEYPRKYLHEITADEWRRTLDTNLSSMFWLSQLAVPHMVEKEWGRIVNLTSILGVKGSRHGVHYASSKAGILGFTKSLALELAPQRITVNAVAPGVIDTDITASDTPEQRGKRLKQIPLGRVGTPDDVAAAVSFLCGDGAAYITGQTLHVNGGFLMP